MTASGRAGTGQGRLPAAFLDVGGSSFVDFLTAHAPHALPGGLTSGSESISSASIGVPHGTTIVALTCAGGVVVAGDRRATMGATIARRDMQKVHAPDDYCAVGIAGSAGIAIEIVKLLQVELEHYEKVEGASLSLEGKASRLASMIRGNLGNAFNGLSVLPLLAGFDLATDTGRIFSYDVTGGRDEEHDFYSVGSGSMFARGALKKLYAPQMAETTAVEVCVEALYDAADDDSATGGPDLARRIFPVVAVVDADGFRRVEPDQLARICEEVVDRRKLRPDGPVARWGDVSP
ncbi:MAG: proteasome subunit beta [Ornithinimicrobium sp.]